MPERLVIAAIIIVVGVATWVLYNRWSVTRASQFVSHDPILANAKQNVPTIIYFTTPFCEPCRTLQTPALNDLQRELGDRGVQVIKIDSTQQPEVADRWGVFCAPTTFILDARQTPKHVNRGVASVEQLKRQLQAM